ncbi:MAG: response regulator [Desulfovibrio sp.]|jgi:PAS domain S-box-containing protein|nr:response regulator [Desulfovibrio sp.]
MGSQTSSFRIKLGKIFQKLGLGMRAKLILLFVVIKVLPLILLAIVAWSQSWRLGEDLKLRTTEISSKALEALAETGNIAVRDAVKAIDARATEEIERTSTDYALRVADFLYARDRDVLLAASLTPDESTYRNFVTTLTGRLVEQGKWELGPDGERWVRTGLPEQRAITSSITENDHSFHYRAPDPFTYVSKPLYREITFIDLDGNERVKVTTSPRMDSTLKNVSLRANTFVKAETYWEELKNLKPGEIYVSEVIGEYVGSRIIGIYNPENAQKAGIPYEPENSAYAGKENPVGKRFKGIVRWGTPVLQGGKIVGYVTLALDHDHLMEFTAHPMPTNDRYTEIPDASEGNYAFIWDYQGRSIVHPRHFSIVGYDAATGDPQVPWLEDRIYDAWQASGLPYAEFIKDEPTFVEQSNRKKPARALAQQGLVGLDCRYLNFAPQCTGWFDLTAEGGSGSFLILWSGLWKLNTAAAIPYYTGRYGKSKRGFGFVAIGAGVDDFHRPANDMRETLSTLINETDRNLDELSEATYKSISENLMDTATSLALSTVIMIALVIFIAIWMASVFTRSITRMVNGVARFQQGYRHFRFDEPVKDELGELADSIDHMADSIEASSKGLITIIDLNFRIRYMNDELLLFINKTMEEVEEQNYNEISIFPEKSASDPVRALKDGREPDVVYHAPSGKYFRGRASRLRSPDGVVTGYVITATDVTKILEEQEDILRQRTLLVNIVSSSPDIMTFLNMDQRFLVANPCFADSFGKTVKDCLMARPEDILSPEYAAELIKDFTQVILSREPLAYEMPRVFADGSTEYLDISRIPVFNDDGSPMGMLTIGRNVSRRVRVENDLRAAHHELEMAVRQANKASESKSMFLARMSHEIRTPMNAVIGMADIVKRKITEGGAPVADVLTHIRQIEQSSFHLLGLLNDILDISKIEAGKIELVPESFDLRALADNVASIITPRCLEKKIAFETRLENLEQSFFSSDSLRLRQVLINLLGNAVKFTPECGAITLLIRAEEHDAGRTKVFFSIRDTGIGIAEEAIATIFNPFEQAEGSITRRFGGTGLGLSISHNMVQLFGGELKVRSEVGKGSEFYFSIWLADSDKGAAKKDAYMGTDLSVFIGKRLLLVDDVDINRIIVRELLSETEMEIDDASDGQEAVDTFSKSAEGTYDIILMDIQMPTMSGYDASEAIRRLDRVDAQLVPIIALTANAFKEDIDAALEHGMNGHLAKPVNADSLLSVLTHFLSRPA